MTLSEGTSAKLTFLGVLAWAALYTALVLWLTRGGSALAPDSTDYAEAARSLVAGRGDTINRIIFHTGYFKSIRHPLEVHGLLQPLLIAPFFAFGGPVGAFVRIPSIVLLGALGLIVFWAGRRLFGTTAGLLAAALVLTRADLVFVALLGADDVGLAAFSCAAIACFAIGVEVGQPKFFVLAGVFTALSALEKFSGTVLPGVFAVVLLLRRSTRNRAALARWFYTLLPLMPVMALYVFRNYRVYGTSGSPYGGIEWLGKANFPAYFALYEKPPSVPEAWAELGFGRVLALTANQLQSFAQVIGSDPWLVAGLVGSIWLTRRRFAYGAAVLVYTLALAFVVCVLHHVESRYLSALLPLYAIGFGGAAAAVFEWLVQRAGARRTSLVRSAALAALVCVVLFASRKPLTLAAVAGQALHKPVVCADALEYVRTRIDAAAPILTGNPWLIAWQTDRPAINTPTNGTAAILRVARHYRARFAFTGAAVGGASNVSDALGTAELQSELRPELVFDGQECDVFAIHPGS